MSHNQTINETPIPFRYAVIPMLVMIIIMGICVIVLKASPHVPLLIGTATAAFIASRFGYTWNFIEEACYAGIKMALPAILIIIMIGLTIGSWIGGGIVATMVYYGLELLSPSMFLFTICSICCIVTLAIGSSWATMGTIGVAAMGIGHSIDIPAPMVAGAVISGAYFGDKMSPLSDTTNLAAGITGTDLFDHIRHMFYTTVPGLVIALVAYYVMGMQFQGAHLDAAKINEVLGVLNKSFVITPWLLLVPAVVIVLIARKVPALPALAAGILMGWGCHVWVQGGHIDMAVKTLQEGFKLESGNAMVDELFNRGGIDAMMGTVSLTKDRHAARPGREDPADGTQRRRADYRHHRLGHPHQRHHVRTVHLHPAAGPDVRRGLPPDAAEVQEPVARPRRRRHRHLGAGALEHLRRVRILHAGRHRVRVWSLRGTQLFHSPPGHHHGLPGHRRAAHEPRGRG